MSLPRFRSPFAGPAVATGQEPPPLDLLMFQRGLPPPNLDYAITGSR